MQKTSTPYTREQRGGEQKMTMKPKKATVDFIKQFARVYAYSTMMPAGLGAFIANWHTFSLSHIKKTIKAASQGSLFLVIYVPSKEAKAVLVNQ